MGDPGARAQASHDRREMVQLAIRTHRLVSNRLGRDLYSAPAWDMLLDLYAHEERHPMSLTSLSGAAPGPSRTSLRAIDRLVRCGLLIRSRDQDDGRRINVALSHDAIDLLDGLFDEMVQLFTIV